MRVAGVVHDQVGDDAHPALVCGVDKLDEVAKVAELGQHFEKVADVVSAVPQRRLIDRQQPDAVDAEPVQVVELLRQATDVTGAVRVGVMEPANEDLVEDRALVPKRIARLLDAIDDRAHERTTKMWAGSTKGSRRT